MPNLEQLTYVRDHAAGGVDECRERFMKIWPDEADFEKCWSEVARDCRTYQARERKQSVGPILVCGAIVLSMIGVGYYGVANDLPGLRAVSKLGVLFVLPLGYFIYRYLRLAKSG